MNKSGAPEKFVDVYSFSLVPFQTERESYWHLRISARESNILQVKVMKMKNNLNEDSKLTQTQENLF